MNNKNFKWQMTIALFLIGIAALLGQVRKWSSSERRGNVPITETSRSIPSEMPPLASMTKRTDFDAEPEALVKFKANVSLAQIKQVIGDQNDRVEDSIENVSNLVSIDDLDGKTPAEVAAQYKNLDIVEYAEPVFEIRLDPTEQFTNDKVISELEVSDTLDTPNDPFFTEQWALSNKGANGGKDKADLDALKAWQNTTGSQDVVIGVLDSGVDYNHQDLMSNIWHRPDKVPAYFDAQLGTIDDKFGFNSADNDADPMDDNGHGTHCAGILGAEGNNNEGIAGMNWNVQIMPLKFLGRNGFGSTKNAVEAINYVIDRKKNGVNIRIISASLGSTSYSKALEDVIRKAGENDILFVAASGNSKENTDTHPHYPSSYNLPNVISVAALDRTDSLASFSNFGAKTVHVAAPGKEIVSTWLNGDYREASGTSMATPYVSGVAGLILAKHKKLSAVELRSRLIKATDPIAGLNGKVISGGRLNAAKALGL